MKELASFGKKSLSAMLMAGVIASAPVGAARADQTGSSGKATFRGAMNDSHSGSSAGFDWLAKRNTNAGSRAKVVLTGGKRTLGTGSWICSPAGFGKKSRCYRR